MFVKIGIGTPNPASAVNFMLHRLGFAWFNAADTWHVNIPGLEQTAVNITVNGFFADIKLVSIVCCDVLTARAE
jgi:hypothetical protein